MSEHKDDIEKYLRGELSPEEMHSLEKKALNDPFLADALEGAGTLDHDDFASDLADIQSRIASRQLLRRHWFTPVRIAATLLFLLVASVIVYWLAKPVEPVTLAQQTTRETQEPKRTDELQNLPQAVPKPEEAGKENLSKATQAREEALLRAQEEELTAQAKQAERLNKEEIESVPNSSADAKLPAKEREQVKPSESRPPATLQVEENAGKSGISQETKSQTLNLENKKKEKVINAEGPAGNPKLDYSPSENDLARNRQKASQKISATAVRGEQNVIKGKVTVAEDGTTLPGASIMVKGSREGVVTNIDGEFSLTTNSKQDTLTVSFVGFQTKTVAVSNTSSVVNVALASDPLQLSEVVVISFENKPMDFESEQAVTLATPAGGTQAYHQYLKKNLRYPEAALASRIEGKVGLEFIVAPDGGLGDLKITRSLGYGCDEEVIRLVKEGPGWEPSFLGSKKLSSKVRIRLRFKLPR